MPKAGALAARPTEKGEGEKGRVDQTRVRRYWAGKAPEWAAAEQQVSDLQIVDREVARTEVAAPVIVKKADPRLARLAATHSEDLQEARERHREIRAAEIVRRQAPSQESDSEPGGEGAPSKHAPPARPADEDDDDEEEALRRRAAVRERLLQQQRLAEQQQQERQQEQQQAEEEEEEEEEEGEDDSEYETDSEEDAAAHRLIKPVFVPKQARETIAERERLEAEEEALLEYEKKRLEERKVETREILKLTIEAEEAAAKAAAEEARAGKGNPDDIVTDDEAADETTEFEAWRLRELARIKALRDERERQEREAAERARLRNMTDEERRAWEAANPKQAPGHESKKKWRFMQKYWHKGAFFQEAADDMRGTTERDAIFDRDYSAPTGEDRINKELLPKVMQVRNFGRSGRTKWTHLLAEDTTQLLAEPLAPATADRKRLAGGVGSPDAFSKPKKFKT